VPEVKTLKNGEIGRYYKIGKKLDINLSTGCSYCGSGVYF